VFFYLFVQFGFANEYYVTTMGSDSNDGSSESKSWRTISHAAKIAKAGDVVWIKAGNYGKENVVFRNDGEKQSPIFFRGYKNAPDDIQSLYYKYSTNSSLDPDEMPLLDGGNRAEGIGLKLYSRKFVVIENIQVTNYRYCIDALSGANNLVFNRVIASNSGGTKNYPPISGGNCIRMDSKENHSNTIRNSIVLNATMVAMTLGGNNNLIENNQTFADQDDIDGDKRSMDYHVLISGSNNIVRNHYAEHVGDLKHTGHGIVMKTLAGTVAVENNLIENCDLININT